MCARGYATTKAGVVRHHSPPDGSVGVAHCAGGGLPPTPAPGFQPVDEPLALPTVTIDSPARTPCGCEFDAQSDQPKHVWTGCLLHACDHHWSGWTVLPTTMVDFRHCAVCGLVQLQDRPPCQLCGSPDARSLDVPDYGPVYVCTPCVVSA